MLGEERKSISGGWTSESSHEWTLALRHIGELQAYESSSSSALASEGFLYQTIEPIMLYKRP